MIKSIKARTSLVVNVFAVSLAFFSPNYIFAASPAMSQAAHKGAGTILLARASTSDKASPEVGFGDKSEDEIMKEKERDTKIGSLGDMSGELQSYGEDSAHGAELAADEINAQKGIRGKEFDLLVFDTRGSVAGARFGVEAFIRHKVVAIVGAGTSEVSFAANKMLNENQMVMISAGSRRRLGDTGPYNFRNSLTDKDGVSGLLDYIANNRKWKNFALISSVVDDYSIQLSAVYKVELLNRDFNITHELFLWARGMDNILKDERSLEAQLKQMAENPPDAVVFTGGSEEAANLVREMRKKGLNMPLVGFEDHISDAFNDLGELAVGSLVYSGFDVNSKKPKTRKFVKDYTAKFGSPPSRMAALAYDSYYILAQGLEKAKSMRPSHIRDALMHIDNYDGVTGVTSIGESREAKKNAFIFEFSKNGAGFAFENVFEK